MRVAVCRLGLVVIALGVVAGCGRSDPWPAASVATTARMFDDGVLPRLNPPQVLRAETVRTWDLRDPSEQAHWRTVGRKGFRATAAGIEVDAQGASESGVVTEVEVDAASVDALLVHYTGILSPGLRLRWGRPGQEACRLGDHDVPAGETPDGNAGVVRFPVDGQPDWSGPIGRLCLTAQANPRPSKVHRIDLVREIYRPEAAPPGPVRGRIGSETRPAWLGRPGEPREWRIRPARGSVLEFGFGATGHGSAGFRLIGDAGSGERELFRADVGAGASHPPRSWHSARVPLDEWAGTDLRLSFRTELPEEHAVRGLPLWSEPSVVGPGPAARLPDLVVVSIDTLRPDHMSLYGYERETTPHIERWAENAIVFDNAITTAPWTLPSHYSMLTGLYPRRHGSNHRPTVAPAADLLAARLRKLGYTTVAVTGGGVMHAEVGFDHGFDRYAFWANRDLDGEIVSNVDTALGWLDELGDRPLFLFAHTYEVHSPYDFREPYFTRFAGVESPPDFRYKVIPNHRQAGLGAISARVAKRTANGVSFLETDDLPTLVSAYDSGIAYADQELARLFDRLEKPPLAKRAAIVLMSDHGEALGDKGHGGHHYLDDFNARIPLVLRLPGGVGGGKRIETQVSLVDVYPTFLDLIGEPWESVDGRSLLPFAAGTPREEARPVWIYASASRRGLAMRLDNRWKYMLNNSATPELLGEERLYDLEADPDEASNVAADHPGLHEFRRQAQRYLVENGGGLEIRLRAPAAGSMIFRIHGGGLNPTTTKTPVLDPDLLTWMPHKALHVSLAPSQETSLLVENADWRSIRIRVLEGTGSPFGLRLDEAALPVRVVLRAGALEVANEEDRGEAVVTLSWRGRQPTEQTGEGDELRRGLKALGYIN